MSAIRGEATARLKSHLAQKRDHRVYVGVPLCSPMEWKQAIVEEQELSLRGERVALEDITSFLVVYANGQVLDAEKPFPPLPEGVRFAERNRHACQDVLDLSKLAEGKAFVSISFGASASHPNEASHYSTMIRNISDTKIRVSKFAGYAKSGDTFLLNTISGDFFSADEFINWYGVAKDGWVQPGRTVTDPNNYGGDDGYWVYYFETNDGREFTAGARIPEQSDPRAAANMASDESTDSKPQSSFATGTGDFPVNMCSVPAFMGHEEIVLPMLVFRSSKWGKAEKLGGFWHCADDQFQPNDLSNTVAAGLTLGSYPMRINLEKIFVGMPFEDWKRVPEISAALDGLGSEYAFFLEESASPLHDGFLRRCRFIARNRLCDFHPRVDLATETRQTRAAQETLAAFLQPFRGEPVDKAIYGDYYHSFDFIRRFGDDEQFSCGYAIWLEEEGVVRAWTRVTYVPK